jgi:integrase
VGLFTPPFSLRLSHVVDPRKSWARVLKRSGIADLRPHDLRRSLGSWQAIAGASLQVIGASLGHKDPKATAVYSRLLVDPIRTSVNGAVQSMLEAANGKGAGHDDL